MEQRTRWQKNWGWFTLVGLLLRGSVLWAQPATALIDARPSYQPWQQEYVLEKIQYDEDKTIFYCLWRCDNARISAIWLPTAAESFAWRLQDVDLDTVQYRMRSVRNIRRNGVLILPGELDESFSMATAGRQGYTTFQFEVHFPPIPRRTAYVHFIAGQGKRYNPNHFNCFRIHLHQGRETIVSTAAPALMVPPPPPPAPDTPPTVLAVSAPADTPTIAPPPTYQPTGDAFSTSADPPCGKALVLQGIRFLDNQPELDGRVASRQTLRNVADYLVQHPQTTATLYGHTDVFGDPAFNLKLSEQRAKVIQRLLVQYGIREERLTCAWFGAQRPLHPEGDARNRRVEVQLHCP